MTPKIYLNSLRPSYNLNDLTLHAYIHLSHKLENHQGENIISLLDTTCQNGSTKYLEARWNSHKSTKYPENDGNYLRVPRWLWHTRGAGSAQKRSGLGKPRSAEEGALQLSPCLCPSSALSLYPPASLVARPTGLVCGHLHHFSSPGDPSLALGPEASGVHQ